MQNLILFASGGGSNAAAIIQYFAASPLARVAHIYTNKPQAGVLAVAEHAGIPASVIDPNALAGEAFIESLKTQRPALIILAGYLKKIPAAFLHAFPNKIINIHPALLPSFGGQGMYGMRVHEAVLQAGIPESGITIHWVNEHYDEGNVLLQARCPVVAGDTAATLAARIHRLEHFYLPRTIEFLLREAETGTPLAS